MARTCARSSIVSTVIEAPKISGEIDEWIALGRDTEIKHPPDDDPVIAGRVLGVEGAGERGERILERPGEAVGTRHRGALRERAVAGTEHVDVEPSRRAHPPPGQRRARRAER